MKSAFSFFWAASAYFFRLPCSEARREASGSFARRDLGAVSMTRTSRLLGVQESPHLDITEKFSVIVSHAWVLPIEDGVLRIVAAVHEFIECIFMSAFYLRAMGARQKMIHGGSLAAAGAEISNFDLVPHVQAEKDVGAPLVRGHRKAAAVGGWGS